MRRVFSIVFFLFFIVAQLSPLYADTPTPPPILSVIPVDGILVPGVTCGIAGDPDPGKTKCCVPKRQDNSILNDISNYGSQVLFVGKYIKTFVNSIDAPSALQQSVMPPCTGDDVVPSTPTDLTNKTCICIPNTATASAALGLSDFCKRYFPLSTDKNNELMKCSNCMSTGGFYTAAGCVPLDVSTFITSYILTTGIGIAGGIALLCILYSAFRMQTSMGNAEALKKAQENLTACITGLIIIIFSVLILKIIGVDILRIPGFG